MIELHTWGTPNGRKISIMLEECGLAYTVHKIDISKGEQHKPDFLRISPNNRIPAILDTEGPGGKPYSLFESGAILIYLADKTQKFLPADGAKRYDSIQWLMWQMGGFGPMLGQAHHFLKFAPEKIPYAMKRYAEEAKRLYGVIDKRLGEAEYLAGDYSIADIATFPWAQSFAMQNIDFADYPNVKRWFDAILARPAVQRGIKVGVKS